MEGGGGSVFIQALLLQRRLLRVYVSDVDGTVVPGLEDYSSSYWSVCFLVQFAFQRHSPSDRSLLTNLKAGR